MNIKQYFLFSLISSITPLVFIGHASAAFSKTEVVANRTLHFDEEITNAVRKNLIFEVDQLKLLKSPDFENVDLGELRLRLQKLLVLVSEGEPFVGSGYRNGAVNFVTNKAVVYNFERLKAYPPTQRILLQWHEALGALGYNDDNYLLSSMIVQKLRMPKLELHSQLKVRFQRQFNEIKRDKDVMWNEFAGGATGVGGGGDGDLAEIKWALLFYFNDFALKGKLGSAKDTVSMLDLAIGTPIESTEFEANYHGAIKFHRIKLAINNFTLKICLLIDSKFWAPLDHTQGVIADKNLELLSQILLVLKTIHQSGGLP